MNFVASKSLPLDFTGKYCHFAHTDLNRDDCQFVDLRIFMHEHQESWLKDIGDWHCRLSAAAAGRTRDWWLSPGSRLVGVYPDAVQNFLIAVAMVKICSELQSREFALVGFPSEVSNYLVEMGHSVVGDTPYCDNFIRQMSGAVIHLLMDSLKMLVYRAKNHKNVCDVPVQCPIIVYSHLLGMAKDLDLGDHFYGYMLQDCPNFLNQDKLWVYFNDSTVPLTPAIRADIGRRHGSKILIFQDYLSVMIVFRSIVRAVKIWYSLQKVRDVLPSMECCGVTSQRATVDFYRSTIRCHFPLTEVALEGVFDEILKKTGATKVIFPYEEKPLERAILNSCRHMAWPIKVVGLAHAVHNPVHLYLRRTRSKESLSPKPNVIATTGKIASEVLNEWANIPLQEMVSVGSKRYRAPIPRDYLGEQHARVLKVLILIGLQDELPILASWVEQRHDLFKGCCLIIRKYPYSWQEQQNSAIVRLRNLGVLLEEQQGPLTAQLAACDVALFSATSTGFEAMLSGIYTLHCNWNSFIAFDPLVIRRTKNSIPHCRDAIELKNALQRTMKMSNEDYRLVTSKQIEFAKTVYSPIDKQAIASILGPN